ncbi:hypothetical protein K435DRAFT_572732, partial [Dendrothele bispora CBS 962.96]
VGARKVGKRWLFKCKYCSTYVYRPYSMIHLPASNTMESFTAEHPRPSIANLTFHIKCDHQDKIGQTIGNSTEMGDNKKKMTQSAGSNAASERLMREYIEEGKLNPALVKTRKGFLEVFTAWILEDQLPWTTGESQGLRRVFEYLRVQFRLPTDTTTSRAIAIVMDNASSCDTMAHALGLLLSKRYSIHFHPENNRIRCLAHVVNLVVQAILKALDEVDK